MQTLSQDLRERMVPAYETGDKPAVSGQKEVALREHLKNHPDATVLERRDALGLQCSEKTPWQTLHKMGWRFKKSRHAPPSKIAASKIEPTLP